MDNHELDRRFATVMKAVDLGLYDLDDRWTRTRLRMEFGSADWHEWVWFYGEWVRRKLRHA